MNSTFRPRRPMARRTHSVSSSSSDSVKIEATPGTSGMNKRGKSPIRRRAHSKSSSPMQRRACGTRPRTRSRSPMHQRSNERNQRGNDRPLDELKNITIDIRRSLSGDNATLRREIVVNPHNVFVVRRPGEGSKPLFDREEIKANLSDERRVVRNSSSPSKSDRDERKRRRERDRRDRTRSRSRSRSRTGRHLIDQRYVHKLRRTRSRSPRHRRRSRSRSNDRRRDRRIRSRERDDPYEMMPMYPVPLRPRIPIFGPVMPYHHRPYLRPILPLRPFPRMRMMFPRVYPAFRHP